MACAPESPLAEIHQQKGDIVEHVDGGEPVVELDGIEQGGRAIDLDDIAQMQIAVAVAHIAASRPRLEQRREHGEPHPAGAREVDYRLARQSNISMAVNSCSLSPSTPASGGTACSGESARSAAAWKVSIAAARRGIEARSSRPSLAMRS